MIDSLHMGRSCIDLYSNDIGAAFFDIKSFSAYVGGSPTNISVGARRLGRRLPHERRDARRLPRLGSQRAGGGLPGAAAAAWWIC